MSDTMLFGVLKMPFEMAMKDEISRLQYYARVQELVGRFEAQQQAEPVACQSCQDIGGNWAWKCNLCGEVDESREPEPPQRPWVGLTDEEILSTDPWEILRADPWMGTSDSNINPYQILLKVRTLEAKLKERNT